MKKSNPPEAVKHGTSPNFLIFASGAVSESGKNKILQAGAFSAAPSAGRPAAADRQSVPGIGLPGSRKNSPVIRTISGSRPLVCPPLKFKIGKLQSSQATCKPPNIFILLIF